ncbi:unnamed protein product [Acanthoscelides obtectus]|uniref:Uncharacterized protein n=1 Tax=Acanthoscelides obtectus TaxID=200917 RepID=A0A9P0JUM2_ACAOB|nr:unnamed protein product [Acanthoscelides obtectus]CAK1625256.1 hypothetical protein AOBTE_LOCUS3063 [Acanthoscelides obtectus]
MYYVTSELPYQRLKDQVVLERIPHNSAQSEGCKFCSCDILIARGKGEIKKHITTAKHIKLISTIKSLPSVASMFGKKSKNIDEKAKEDVLRLAGFIAEHNLPIRLMEHIPNLVKSICTDSESYQMYSYKND